MNLKNPQVNGTSFRLKPESQNNYMKYKSALLTIQFIIKISLPNSLPHQNHKSS